MCQIMFKENIVDSLLIGDESKNHYVLIKDFNTFMFDHAPYLGRKHIFVHIVYMLLVQKKS